MYNSKNNSHLCNRNQTLGNQTGHDGGYFEPAVNIGESKDAFVIQLSLPGFDKSNIDVQVKDNSLKIEGKKSDLDLEGASIRKREFFRQNFNRSFFIPKTVNQNDVSAVFKNGIMEVKLPKLPNHIAVEKKVAVL